MDFEQSGSPNSIEADHIVPHSLGGPDHVDNIQIICRTCNRRKGDGAAKAPRPIIRAQPPTRITVQCSTCLRTLTDDVFWAVNACNFRPDAGTPGHTKYRRCRDCVAARRHPEAR